MTTFKYELRNPSGDLSSGVLQASNLMDATEKLRNQGGYVVSLRPAATGAAGVYDRLRSVSVEFGPGLKDVMHFTSELAVMIKAGINIRTAIDGVAEQTENPKFRKIIQQIKADVESGQPFSDALARHPKIFSPLYINMVRASELSGSFGKMLERIANYLSQQIETRSMVRGAMIYPAIIAFMAIATTIFLLTFVLPKFTVMFQGKEDLLPKPTVALLAISDFVRFYWYVLVGGVVGLGVAFYYWIHTPGGRVTWDRTKLRIPIMKRMFRAMYITRGLQTMGELLTAGVPVLETIKITANVSGNTLYQRMWEAVRADVKQGEKICTRLFTQPLLPKSVVQMIAAGEESGELGPVLRDISEYYARELRSTIKAVTAMIEPLMIVLMGVIVGFIAMSMILPVFKMSSLVK